MREKRRKKVISLTGKKYVGLLCIKSIDRREFMDLRLCSGVWHELASIILALPISRWGSSNFRSERQRSGTQIPCSQPKGRGLGEGE